MGTNLRYYAKTDTYYLQIRGAEYARINTKIRHIRNRLKYIQAEKYREERASLERRYRSLLEKKAQAERYVEIRQADIPDSAAARPIYNFPGEVITAEPKLYAELLERLRKDTE